MVKYLLFLLIVFNFSFAKVEIVLINKCEDSNSIFLKKETTKSFFYLYEENRKLGIPNLITTDFVLTANSLIKEKIITKIEKEYLYPLLKQFYKELYLEYMKQKEEKIPEGEAFLLLLNILSGNEIDISTIDKNTKKLIKKELENIQKGGIKKSYISDVKLDFSLLKPVGKYSNDKDLSSYYKAVKYASSNPFIIYPSKMNGVSKQKSDNLIKFSYQLYKILSVNSDLNVKYQKILKIFQNLAGNFEDLDLLTFEKVFIIEPSAKEIRKSLLKSIEQENKYPLVISFIMTINSSDLDKFRKSLVSIRIIPSSLSLDSYVFQNLTYPKVGKYLGNPKILPFTAVKTDYGIIRGFPTIIDILSVLKIKKARDLECKNGLFKNFFKQLEVANKYVYKNINNLNSLCSYDFYTYKNLISLNKITSFKGYYTQSRYNYNLYLKESTTGLAKGISRNRKKAKIDKSLNSIFPTLIEQYYFLYSLYENKTVLKVINIFKRLREISKKYPDGIVSDEKDIKFINNLDIKFKSLINTYDKPISVTLHFEPNTRQYLIEGLCYPIIKKEKEYRGAIYNHIEIKSDKRLTVKEFQNAYCE